MVSSAIVISVQATTIRAANLLASFVVVPVAFLLQGETVLISGAMRMYFGLPSWQ
jgi:hypothetical protein